MRVWICTMTPASPLRTIFMNVLEDSDHCVSRVHHYCIRLLHPNTTRAMCVKIMWKGCEKCVKKRNHVKSMLAKIQVHHISISHACELFDMRVKFCNTCEKFLSYVWTFFPCILLHVKSFHTCETILSCMWTSNFTCIIDAMHVKFFTCMWTPLDMSEWACEFFSGLVQCSHYEPYFYENVLNF